MAVTQMKANSRARTLHIMGLHKQEASPFPNQPQVLATETKPVCPKDPLEHPTNHTEQ